MSAEFRIYRRTPGGVARWQRVSILAPSGGPSSPILTAERAEALRGGLAAASPGVDLVVVAPGQPEPCSLCGSVAPCWCDGAFSSAAAAGLQ